MFVVIIVVVAIFVTSEICGIAMVSIREPQVFFILENKRAHGVNGKLIRGVRKLIFDP